MSKTIKLAFLWHMHQPDYRDAEGIMKMPWVFLHAIKDYYDMPWILTQFPQMKATFNLTPSLIEQLKLYANPLENDYFLQLWSRYPSELSFDEKEWLIKIYKSAIYNTMIKPLPRFNELFHLQTYTDDELNDLQIQYLLSWCGNYLRLNNDTVKMLLQKERDYSYEDKKSLLHALSSFVGEILPFYSSLLQKGAISISTTPYFHPILPLLINMDNVQKSNIHTKPPKNPLSFKADAVKHVQRAIVLYKETFGVDPVGFWPAEGAVDEESVAIYKEEGIEWIATDEAILFKSLDNDTKANIYQPYDIDGLFIAFRDHGLSDLLGFDYRFKPAGKAVEHFISSIEPLASPDNDTIFIILDGENAWEYYPDNAYPFFMQFYKRLSELSWCKTVCMDELLKDERVELDSLTPGSWINGDFSTWSGHVEKNRAWELLFQTRRDVDNCTYEISQENKKEIENNFLAAECSDWFWWYGDDHFTEFAAEFDSIFRKHLISIYNLLQIQPPSYLYESIIKHKNTSSYILKPQSPIYPKIDGKTSSFFEWVGCGVVHENRSFSTMDKERGPVEKIRYGHNETMVYIAFDGDIARLSKKGTVLELIIEELSESITLGLETEKHPSGIVLCTDTSFEIALPKTLFAKIQTVHLRFEIEQDGKMIQTLPGFEALELKLNEDYSNSWFV
ncbi:glycoside hydrolase [bacterium]|nr:glycoside hydrolase [bacterium]MBU1993679.1 glycoside hydrolase [bacterium]